MSPYNNEFYEFGEFTLNPRDRLLTRSDRTINLNGKDFDVLAHFVQNPGALVLDRDLINSVWGDGHVLRRGNITNHIAKIRKALNCDSQNPKFIVTHYGKRAYRFIAKVTRTDSPGLDAAQISEQSRGFTLESQLISPVFLGLDTFDSFRAPEKGSSWAVYKEFKIDNGRLCLFPSGVGLWHLTGRNQFASFSAVAEWRRSTYDQILKGHHVTHIYNEKLKAHPLSRPKDPFISVLGTPGYIFSILALEAPKRERPDRIRKSLQLLSCLRSLEKLDPTSENAVTENLERGLLDGTFSNLDTTEFGVPGVEYGFASWAGLSYLLRANGHSTLTTDIVEFEIGVQATWWLSKCLYEICLSKGAKAKKELEASIQALKWQFAKVQSIVPTESTSQRTMIEAVLITSRLHKLVEDTIKLYDQL
ncbi:MAG: winged helix-turn-helix domain-containing protein [Blastocatellia bacterium]|jgi:DNA-binding winged helix-turn-helix (wHTH) protein|nr:winged helix-turn-helix domain-containing protein [Blastocatellia bacterium]